MKYYSIDFKLSPCNEAFCDVLSGEIAALGFESYEYGEDGIVGYIPCNLFDKNELDNTLADLFCTAVCQHPGQFRYVTCVLLDI